MVRPRKRANAESTETAEVASTTKRPRRKRAASKAAAKKAPTKRKGRKSLADAEGLCHCGCGEETKPKRSFRQGHDARFHGRVKKLAAGVLTVAELKTLIHPYALVFYEAE